MSENVSTLEAGCDQYVGRTLIVEPHYGYGWYHPPGGPFGDPRVPIPEYLSGRVAATASDCSQGGTQLVEWVEHLRNPSLAFTSYDRRTRQTGGEE